MAAGSNGALVRALLARTAFPAPRTPLRCGVSGGADSLALLVLAVAAGCEVTAVHVDHGLRPGSSAEAGVVAAAAERLGARFDAARVEVEPGPNLEARARRARHAVLGADAALGHTADDQAETMLVNLLRGAALDGLAGMRPGPRHPILALRRRETAMLCARVGLDPVADPSNADPAFVRNRVRHELLPLMADIAGRDPVPVLARQAGVVRAAADHLAAEAAFVDATDVEELRAAPPPVAATALRRWLRDTNPDRHPPDAATLDRVLAVVAGRTRAAELRGGWRVARTAGRLRLEAPEAADPEATDPCRRRP